jgi:hypothetical protein
MSAVVAPPPPVQRPPLLTFVSRVMRRGPPVILRNIRKRLLQSDYARGRANPARNLPPETTDPVIVETARALREQLMATHHGKHSAAGYRVLMLLPGSITAEIWFGDLQRCMRHAGIDCEILPPAAPTAEINAAFESFQPNVFIATEATEALQALDLAFLQGYKRRHGCLRFFIPVWHSNLPRKYVVGKHSTPELDAWRRRLRWSGLTADAHFSLFERGFHERFARDPKGPDIEYVVIAQACNPFVDYPVATHKCHDYLMATSMTDDRVEVTWRFLRPILGRYRGLWAGSRWGFGVEPGIPPADLAFTYSQARIALSPLVGFVHHYGAELTHRVFAAAGCGAFQITMPTPVTHRYFRPDELIQAATPREYVRLFAHYVDRPDLRNAIALAALRRTYGEHTCFHRVDTMVSHWNDWRRRGLF